MSLFLADRLTGVFFFGLPILDRIELPTAVVTKRLYSNLDVDLALAATHTPAIAADALAPSPLRLALAGCRGPSGACCACLRRLPRSSRRRRLHNCRLAFTNRAATPDASSEGRLGASLSDPRLRVSIAGPSSPSSPGTSPTTTPRVPICVPSSRTWSVLRRRRSDQPILHTSTPSTSPSTRLPPFEHRAAAALPLRAVASPPLVPIADYRHAFSGMYVASGSHAAGPTRALQLRHPTGM
jgi:hypothetical protein